MAPEMEATRTDIEQNPMTPRNYLWEAPEKPVSIQVSFDVIDRLLAAILKGFASVPRRGAEVGGILLGSIEIIDGRREIRIEDYEPVRCEYGNGPSYLLSERDLARFQESLQRWGGGGERRLYAVGFYRSNTREGLGMTAHDLAMFDKYFPDPSAVVMLVKPFATRVSTGAFFFREGDTMRSDSTYKEFPFRRKELGGGSAPSGRSRNPETTEEDEVVENRPARRGQSVSAEAAAPASAFDYGGASEAPMRFAMEPNPARRPENPKKGWVWIPLSFIFLFLGVLLGFQAAISMRPRVPALTAEAFVLSLSAVKNGETLEIRWDRNSQAVRNATRGLLTIKDGSYNKSIDLDQAQLGVGKVIYRRLSDAVHFRLEVFPKEQTSVTESIDYRDGK